MRRRHSTFRNACAAAAALACVAVAVRASAQACCAGTGAVTPARLSLHEDALVGATLHEATVLGSYDPYGRYAALAAGTSEFDYQQDLFGALRVLRRGQLALLVPLVETVRHIPGTTEVGGGIGDINLSGRYDFYLAGQSRLVPGVAVLLGLTVPTGRPPESAHNPLATDATGVGAFQGNVGLALEQTYGPWLLNLTGIVAARAARSVQGVDQTLGLQFTGLLATAYTFGDDAAAGLVLSYVAEGDTTINGAVQPLSARSVLTVSLAGLFPLSDYWRLQGTLFMNPPFDSLGANQPSTAGLTLTLIRSWS